MKKTKNLLPDHEEEVHEVKGAPLTDWRKAVAAGRTTMSYSEWADFITTPLLKKGTVVNCGDDNLSSGIVQKDAIANDNTKILIRTICDDEWTLESGSIQDENEDIVWDVTAYDNSFNGRIRRAHPRESRWNTDNLFREIHEVDSEMLQNLQNKVTEQEAELEHLIVDFKNYRENPEEEDKADMAKYFADLDIAYQEQRSDIRHDIRFLKYIIAKAKTNPPFPERG